MSLHLGNTDLFNPKLCDPLQKTKSSIADRYAIDNGSAAYQHILNTKITAERVIHTHTAVEKYKKTIVGIRNVAITVPSMRIRQS